MMREVVPVSLMNMVWSAKIFVINDPVNWYSELLDLQLAERVPTKTAASFMLIPNRTSVMVVDALTHP